MTSADLASLGRLQIAWAGEDGFFTKARTGQFSEPSFRALIAEFRAVDIGERPLIDRKLALALWEFSRIMRNLEGKAREYNSSNFELLKDARIRVDMEIRRVISGCYSEDPG